MMEMFNSENWTNENWHPGDEELLMLMDGELPAKELAFGRTHLDACWTCRARSEELQYTISSFVKYNDSILSPLIDRSPRNWGGFKARLNKAVVETGNPRPWYRNLLPIKTRFSLFTLFDNLRSSIFGFPLGRHGAFVPVATLVLVFTGLLAWFAISPSSGISASEILSESERRAGLWYRQPDKVLHWGWETTVVNSSHLPDGTYRSLHWLDNRNGRSLRLSRKYDQNGELVWGAWTREDGSEVVYNHFPKDEITINPTEDALRAYAAGLDERRRQTVEQYIQLMAKLQQMEAAVTTRGRALGAASNNASLQIIETADVGKVFRIKLVSGPNEAEKFSSAEMEYDIAADTFIKHRTKSVRHYLDGKMEVQEARLGFYRESSVDEFNANDLSNEMRQVANIVHVTPEQFLKHVTPEAVLKISESTENYQRKSSAR